MPAAAMALVCALLRTPAARHPFLLPVAAAAAPPFPSIFERDCPPWPPRHPSASTAHRSYHHHQHPHASPPPPLVSTAWLEAALDRRPSLSSQKPHARLSSPAPPTPVPSAPPPHTPRVVPLDASWYRPQSQRTRRRPNPPAATAADRVLPQKEAAVYNPDDDEVHPDDADRDAMAEYLEGPRLPGAKFFDVDAISDPMSSVVNLAPSPADFEEHMDRLGVTNDDHIVFYDTVGVQTAPRGYWLLRAMGHERVSVLDGGLPKWQREGRALEFGPPSQQPPSEDVVGDANPPAWRTPSYRAMPDTRLTLDLAAVQRAVSDFTQASPRQLVDVRPPPRFLGRADEPVPGLQSGHAPGSASLHWSRLLDRDAGTLAPSEVIVRAFRAAE
ncbi:hypothetical protein HK405_002973, partial [Cladochytrium tenue]